MSIFFSSCMHGELLLPNSNCAHALLITFRALEMLLSRIRMAGVKRRSSFFRRTIEEIDRVAFNAARAACENSNVRHGIAPGRLDVAPQPSDTRLTASDRSTDGARAQFVELMQVVVSRTVFR